MDHHALHGNEDALSMAVSILSTLIMDACMPCHRPPSSAWCNLAYLSVVWTAHFLSTHTWRSGTSTYKLCSFVLFPFLLYRRFEFKTWGETHQQSPYKMLLALAVQCQNTCFSGIMTHFWAEVPFFLTEAQMNAVCKKCDCSFAVYIISDRIPCVFVFLCGKIWLDQQ